MKKRLKQIQTRRLVLWGQSWGVALNREALRRKGYLIGDKLKVTVEPFNEEEMKESRKENIFAEVATKMMKETDSNELLIRKPKTEQTEQTEQTDEIKNKEQK